MTATSDWADGYTSEVEYSRNFYREMAPTQINFALVLGGYRPLDLAGGYHYCELGCGQGFVANVLAAADPRATIHAVDFNPTHIAGAQVLARAAGSDRVTFLDTSFAQLDQAGLPAFDIIALHGVMSWVGSEHQRYIVRFIDRHLRPGGVVYVSYNCAAGWAAIEPLRHLLAQQVGGGQGRGGGGEPLDRRIDRAMAVVRRVAALNSGYFRVTPTAVSQLELIAKSRPGYIAHEYLNKDWNLFHFDQMRGALAEARLTFAGSAEATGHFDQLYLAAEGRALLDEIPDPVARQVVRDIAIGENFRKDLYLRGALRLSPAERRARLLATRFALTVRRAGLTGRLPFGLRAGIAPHLLEPLAAALAGGDRSLAELLAWPGLRGLDLDTLLPPLAMLVTLGQIAPLADGDHPSAAPAGAFNRPAPAGAFNQAVLAAVADGTPYATLAAPLLGSGVLLGSIDLAFLLAERDGPDDPVTAAWRIIQGQGGVLQRDGVPLRGDADNLAELRLRWQTFISDGRPMLARLGAVE